jgi:uncharacterized protein (DUF1499 family)
MLAILRMLMLVIFCVIVAFVLWVVFVNLTRRESSMWFAGRPSNVGSDKDALAPPKRTPNSVVSEGVDSAHPAFIAPLAFTGDPRVAMAKLLTAIEAMTGATVTAATERYVHAEFRTPKMRYVDDFEARLDVDAEVIHVRSASRLGKRDFNVNRNRVEAIRKRFNSV